MPTGPAAAPCSGDANAAAGSVPLEARDVLPMVWQGRASHLDVLGMDVSDRFLLNIPIHSDEEVDAIAARPQLSEPVMGRLVDIALAGGPVVTARHPLATYAALDRSSHDWPDRFMAGWLRHAQFVVTSSKGVPPGALEGLGALAAHPRLSDENVMSLADPVQGHLALTDVAPNIPAMLGLDLSHWTSRTRPVATPNSRWALMLTADIRRRCAGNLEVLAVVGPLARRLLSADDAPCVEDILDAAFAAVADA